MKNAPKDQNNLKDNLLHGKQRQGEYLFMETTLSSHTKLQMSTHTLTDLCLHLGLHGSHLHHETHLCLYLTAVRFCYL